MKYKQLKTITVQDVIKTGVCDVWLDLILKEMAPKYGSGNIPLDEAIEWVENQNRVPSGIKWLIENGFIEKEREKISVGDFYKSPHSNIYVLSLVNVSDEDVPRMSYWVTLIGVRNGQPGHRFYNAVKVQDPRNLTDEEAEAIGVFKMKREEEGL